MARNAAAHPHLFDRSGSIPPRMMGGNILSRPNQRWPGDPALRARDERLESLKAVVGKLAHDFNNFLVPQFGYLTLLHEELKEGSTGWQYMRNMEAAGRKSEEYIAAILLGMRPHRQFSPHSFALDALFNSELDAWASQLPAGRVNVRRNLEPAVFFGDEKQWRNVVRHLLENARYALALGGALVVNLSRRSLAADEVKRLGLGTDQVFEVTVRDSGFGMNEESVQRAFEPFYTTRTQVKSAGLGLTIVHSVTLFHGGQVELASREEAGTTVTLWIPSDGVAPRKKLASVGGFDRTGPGPLGKVLLAEDDPLVKEVVRTWLAPRGFDVQVPASPVEAARLLGRNSADWILAIIGNTSGASLSGSMVEAIRTALPSLPIAYLSDSPASPGLHTPEMPGAATPAVLQKPFTRRQLHELVLNYSRKQSST